MERCDALIDEFLDGALSASGQDKLADLVRDDSVLRARFVMNAEIAGLLANHFQSTGRAAELVARTMAALPESPPPAGAHDPLVDAVMQRIESPRIRNRQRTALEQFALHSALDTQARLSKIPRFGRWMSFAALLALAAMPLMLFALAKSLRTIAAVPMLRPISGNVYVISADAQSSLERNSKESLAASDGVAVARAARAAVTYWDGTRMELSGDAARLWMNGKRGAGGAAPQCDAIERGRCLLLESGTLEVAAAKQHGDQPLVLRTPHAEVQVIGTKFVLSVGAGQTRVTVLEGQVRFTRTADKRSISVGANEYAVVADSSDLIARPLKQAN